MKPNIFNIATSELSQDAFITWLLLWADESNAKESPELHHCAVEFVTELIKKEHPEFAEPIKTVSAGRQWENIDVWAKVNNEYLIVIEDKTFTEEHSNQLKRYKEFATNHCKEKLPTYKSPICIYFKIGNESQLNLGKVHENGFKSYSRNELANLLTKHTFHNDIFEDFKIRLLRQEESGTDWEEKQIKDWKDENWQVFFQYLEQTIGLGRWDFVNNPSGGFWNAILNWQKLGLYPFYIQLEQTKLCFKISTHKSDISSILTESQSNVRSKYHEIVMKAAKARAINSIKKPNRFGTGNYMTVAIVDCENWLGEIDKPINKEQVIERLKFFNEFLMDLIKEENEKQNKIII